MDPNKDELRKRYLNVGRTWVMSDDELDAKAKHAHRRVFEKFQEAREDDDESGDIEELE